MRPYNTHASLFLFVLFYWSILIAASHFSSPSFSCSNLNDKTRLWVRRITINPYTHTLRTLATHPCLVYSAPLALVLGSSLPTTTTTPFVSLTPLSLLSLSPPAATIPPLATTSKSQPAVELLRYGTRLLLAAATDSEPAV